MIEVPQEFSADKSSESFELVDYDDYHQFVLHSQVEISSVLRSLIKKNVLTTIHLGNTPKFILSSLLALRDADNTLILDASRESELNAFATQQAYSIVSTTVDKIKIQFDLGRLTQVEYEGHAALKAAMPPRLLRLQRREFFRLSTPITTPVMMTTCLQANGDQQEQLDVPMLDISGGGVGLMVAERLSQRFTKDLQLKDCRIHLPGEGMLICDLLVRNLFDVSTRSGTRYRRVGCEFLSLSPQKLMLIQRFITKIERERKAKMSGIL